MKNRIQPPDRPERPTRPIPDDREARVRILKERIRLGRYDAESKIDGLIEGVLRDAM